MAQYYSLYSWLLSTIVRRSIVPFPFSNEPQKRDEDLSRDGAREKAVKKIGKKKATDQRETKKKKEERKKRKKKRDKEKRIKRKMNQEREERCEKKN